MVGIQYGDRSCVLVKNNGRVEQIVRQICKLEDVNSIDYPDAGYRALVRL